VDRHFGPGSYTGALTSDAAKRLAPGVYFLRMAAGDYKHTERVIFIR
jgi:hypothetical protein